jgi:hypothetical protein
VYATCRFESAVSDAEAFPRINAFTIFSAMASSPLALVINPHAADFKLYDEWMHPLGLYLLIEGNGVTPIEEKP